MGRSSTAPSIEGVDAAFLGSFMSSLEEIETAACGYGQMKSCKVEAEDSGHTVVATYRDGHWSVRIAGDLS